MSSAFFRRPGDESSSSSSSDVESAGSEEVGHVSQPLESVDGETGDLGTTESFSSHGSISFAESSAAGRGDRGRGAANSFAGVDHHRTNLIDALLEDFARNRACEVMNNAKPGSNYTRSSPEIETLTRQFHRQATQSLVQTGLLPAAVSEQRRGNEQMRAAYLAGIEGMTLGGVHTGNLISSNLAATPLLSSEENLAMTRTEQRRSNAFGQLLEQPLRNLSLYDRQSPLSFRSPDFMLSNQSIERPRSHYESSFQQISLLGKGGFGRVYRTFNVFDKKEYAVKKIPLSPRLSQRYKESGHQELEHVLREVQALAQLEHNNVVRYHATWIESPRAPRIMDLHEERPELSLHGRRLIADGALPIATDQPRKALPLRLSPDGSDGIVFGSDSVSQIRTLDHKDDQDQPLWSMKQTLSDPSSARPSEIFTDGRAEPNSREDAVVDGSVYVLHVQMSVYPMTLEQYLAPAPENARSAPSNPMRRHCFHLVPALRILLGILCGLQYIHSKGLVHRDIKPSNIFISSLEMATTAGAVSGGYYDVGGCVACSFPGHYFVNPRIGDFGLVAELARDGERKDHHVDGKADKAVGTEYYRPPRRVDAKEKWKASSAINEKLDVFALGVVLVEMLWHCTTKAERMVVLGGLQKGLLPAGLAGKIDNEGHEPGTGDLVCQCLAGMIDGDPLQRWGCGLVKEQVEEILKQCRVPPNEGSNGEGSSIDAGYGFELRQVRSLDADATPMEKD
ncbi:hypothetical protein PV08_01618 [Exophiala spinifera]|uniref:Protein kinase domain-containing protein n=1 Tax=Exophiala spinifera TaxID=91928 RepID=A0A0D2CC50_9EURO|nr:uncharacterized protein PV08_01618 [Exophiala spinifera]KIW21039.1 hypothetical protein PV08_01618 [Exophiala spinifera]